MISSNIKFLIERLIKPRGGKYLGPINGKNEISTTKAKMEKAKYLQRREFKYPSILMTSNESQSEKTQTLEVNKHLSYNFIGKFLPR